MNEERHKAYLNLINALLRCPSGKEPQILNANQDLIDAGLVEAMLKVAKELIVQGNLDAANSLMNLAGQLMGVYGNTPLQRLSSSPPTSSPLSNPGSQFFFLTQILQAIHYSKGDQQAVYSLLKANLDKLDDNFAKLLRNWATATLPQVKSEQAQGFAEAISHLSLLIRDFPGSKAINLEIAITGYEIAATVFTCDGFREQWAIIQNNLGNAYGIRICGDRSENLKKAIAAFKDSLQVRNPEVFPEQWAVTQSNLGNIYRELGQIDEAIGAFKAALRCCTCEQFLIQWAGTQSNLGIAYRKRGQFGEAIKAFLSALHVFNHEALAKYRAGTQNNLGNTYRELGQIDEAIAVLQDSLRVYTKKAFPEKWAIAQNSLGKAYRDAGQIEEAIKCFRLALEIFEPTAFPIGCLESGRNLGDTASVAGFWAKAIQGYGVAIEAVEQSREWGSSDSRKAEILSAAIDVYAGIVQTYLKNDQPDKALEYVERSKARNLVELLANKNLYPKPDLYPNPDTYQTHCDQLDQLRREIPTKQRQLEVLTRSWESEERYRDEIEQRQQELNQLKQQQDELLREINKVDSSFTFTQTVEPIPFSDIQSLIDDRTAIVEWYITDSQILTFIITRQSPDITVWASTPEDLQALIAWKDEYLQDLTQNRPHWPKQLPDRLKTLAKILHLDRIMSLVPETCNQLILIPHRFLHLFPLHALPLGNGDFLCDRFSNGVGYAPSCQLLQLAQKRERLDFSNLFAIQNPTDDLLYSNLEVEVIRSSFSSTHILLKQAATKTAFKANQDLPSVHCTHFSCHGTFNLASPLESALILANNERLTLGEIFALTLNQCRLVTLSACETGLSDPNSLSDEYISLPSGFLYAGALGVVSSLWAVSDLSTCFLMIKFYENLKNFPKLEAGEVAIALNQAQKWLRDLTSEEFEVVFAKYQPQIEEILAQLPKGSRFEFQDALDQARKKIQAPDRQPKPFANPYYWAAFTATGL
jgi:CHAT domain-containing protein/lipopolysaccharide biosynthesis regulator YciM